jgi:thiamine-phosphate pyrophosphorylase
MLSRQIPRRWLVADERGGDPVALARRLPRGSGILFLYRELPRAQRAKLLSRLRRIAKMRSLLIVDEASRGALRVHSAGELRRAGTAGIPILFLSPVNNTRSHPDWRPLARMRAAALVRLAKVPVIALGGMDERAFRRVGRLGFSGWAGIDAWVAQPTAQKARSRLRS